MSRNRLRMAWGRGAVCFETHRYGLCSGPVEGKDGRTVAMVPMSPALGRKGVQEHRSATVWPFLDAPVTVRHVRVLQSTGAYGSVQHPQGVYVMCPLLSDVHVVMAQGGDGEHGCCLEGGVWRRGRFGGCVGQYVPKVVRSAKIA